jgi:hypothetical protein
MPYADPEKQREYKREWYRMRVAGDPGTPRNRVTAEDIKNAQGMLDVLAETIAEVRSSDAPLLARARCIGYLVGVGLRAVEIASLEARLTELERRLQGGSEWHEQTEH